MSTNNQTVNRCHKCKRLIDNTHHFGHVNDDGEWQCDDENVCNRRGTMHEAGATLEIVI